MTIETALVTQLETSAALVALVGTRIEPVINAQSGAWPALTYQQISGPEEHTHDGGAGFGMLRFQLVATAETYSQAAQVMAAARAVINGARWGDYASFVDGASDAWAEQAGERGVFVRRMDVLVMGPTA